MQNNDKTKKKAQMTYEQCYRKLLNHNDYQSNWWKGNIPIIDYEVPTKFYLLA